MFTENEDPDFNEGFSARKKLLANSTIRAFARARVVCGRRI